MANPISPLGNLPVVVTGAASPKPVSARPAPAAARGSVGSPAAAAAQINQHLQQAEPELKLQVDAGSGRTVYQVIQQGTGEVVLQIPSEEVLGMSRRLREMEGQGHSSGALVDREG
ncbi:MAG: flagellar protein FlaG [Geothrix sp.]|uniref:flagellar protein FlaG n=1 Tax=Geothrix sp. TaxID=1962974 RepID=UPI0017C5F712|nr:flagellar protein FlaG [Geothrix sp.]NWJ41146.1 flagellar protein FlaG [Geothrix sp.]WIL20865.1 MAG: flagellar protein FlaG [Geothrix sp.]